MIGQAPLGIGVQKQRTFIRRRNVSCSGALLRCKCQMFFWFPNDKKCPVLLSPLNPRIV